MLFRSVSFLPVANPFATEKVEKYVAKNKELSYLEEFNGVSGLKPKNIEGSVFVVLFNKKNNKLAILQSLENSKFSLKGSKIVEIDSEKSFMKIVKVGIDLEKYKSKNKKTVMSLFNLIKTKGQKSFVKLDENILILNSLK